MYSKDEVSRALSESRLIVVEYPYRPRVRQYERTAAGRRLIELLQKGMPRYQSILEDLARFNDVFSGIEVATRMDDPEPCWKNGMLPGLDGMFLYWLIRTKAPKCYLEIGSGNSTKFVRRAIKDGDLSTRIVSVDPHPRAVIDDICDQIIRAPCEDVDSDLYRELLTSGDVVFVDNSHRSFQSSDVTVFFTEMLPSLPEGVIYGVHDIFLPYDYPSEWISRFYNEQYLLLTYILGGANNDEILFPGIYVANSPELRPAIDRLFQGARFDGVPRHAGAFWMRRGGQVDQSNE